MKNLNKHLFNHCPQCGESRITPQGERSFFCPDCRFQLYINCAAAAIGLITMPDQTILVTRRKNDPAKGFLDFPGGFAEPGESIEACLVREIKEELNLDITGIQYAASFPNTYKYEGVAYPITDMVFFCTAEDFASLTPADDVSQAIFMKIKDLDPALFGLDSAKQCVQLLQNENPAPQNSPN